MNSQLIRCGHCGETVSQLARSCPHCGGPWPARGISPTQESLERCLYGFKLIGHLNRGFTARPSTYLGIFFEVITRLSVFGIILGSVVTIFYLGSWAHEELGLTATEYIEIGLMVFVTYLVYRFRDNNKPK